MLPSGLAIGWMLWRRHRWDLMLVLGYLCVASVLSAVLPTMPLAPWVVKALFFAITVPGSILALLIFVFCLGFDADMSARDSCYPPGLFTLPVRTGALAGWPLAMGTAAAVLAWTWFAYFVLRPWVGGWGLTVPLWWPAMSSAAFLAWTQALLWMPFGLPGARILLATAFGAAFAWGTLNSVQAGVSEGKLVAIYAGLTALAWGVAYVGVRRARRGEVPDWLGLVRPLGRLASLLPRSRQPFRSAARAQVWYDWRLTGNSLPLMTAMVLPVALLPLLIPQNDVTFTTRTLLGALAMPVFLGGIAGITESRGRPLATTPHGLTPFMATLPMSTAGMIGAKLRASALGVLITWAIVAVMVPLGVTLTGTWKEVEEWWHQAANIQHPLQAVTAMAAVVVLLVLWTWKRQVDSGLLVLTGRPWVSRLGLVASVVGLMALGFAASWIIHHPEAHEALLAAAPWLLGLLLLARLATAGLCALLAVRHLLLTPHTVARWAAGELVVAAVLFVLLAWSVPGDVLPWYYLAFAILWCLPIGHLAATPLALAWNRHR
jgi:hypothetical protein